MSDWSADVCSSYLAWRKVLKDDISDDLASVTRAVRPLVIPVRKRPRPAIDAKHLLEKLYGEAFGPGQQRRRNIGGKNLLEFILGANVLIPGSFIDQCDNAGFC